MKYMYLRFPLALLLSFNLLFVSCSKEGSTGPDGPAGPAGPTGPTGPAGTANVIYSNWFDLTFTPVKNTGGDTLAYEATKTVAGLTANIINTGEIKVYINAGTPTTPVVYPLPITDLFGLAGIVNLNVNFSVGEIYFYGLEDQDPTTPIQDPSTFTVTQGKVYQYRYVLIPGGTPATASINWNNYQEVKKALELKD